jgi:hypothetical protein
VYRYVAGFCFALLSKDHFVSNKYSQHRSYIICLQLPATSLCILLCFHFDFLSPQSQLHMPIFHLHIDLALSLFLRLHLRRNCEHKKEKGLVTSSCFRPYIQCSARVRRQTSKRLGYKHKLQKHKDGKKINI